MKILFTDLDDTLLKTDKSSSPRMRELLACMLDAGKYICLNTGRALEGAKYFMRRLGLEGRERVYLLAANGAVLYDAQRDEILEACPFSQESARKIFALAKERGIYCQAFEAVDLLVPAVTPESELYISRAHMPYRILPELPEGDHGTFVKLLLIDLKSRQALEDFRTAFYQRHPTAAVDLFFSSSFLLEVATRGVHKGSGMRRLCERLGIPLAEALAVGDQENDIPMLQAAGIGAAVANAMDSAKAAADIVLPLTNDEEAVADLIEEYFL